MICHPFMSPGCFFLSPRLRYSLLCNLSHQLTAPQNPKSYSNDPPSVSSHRCVWVSHLLSRWSAINVRWVGLSLFPPQPHPSPRIYTKNKRQRSELEAPKPTAPDRRSVTIYIGAQRSVFTVHENLLCSRSQHLETRLQAIRKHRTCTKGATTDTQNPLNFKRNCPYCRAN